MTTENRATRRTHVYLNFEATLERFGGDEELFREIAAIMLETAPPHLSGIEEALARGDLKRVYEEAHALRGSIATFDCPQTVRSLTDLERHAQVCDDGPAHAAFSTVQELVHGVLAELERHTRP